MRRFTHNPDGFSSVDESPDGELVRYDEHAADRAVLVAQLEVSETTWRDCKEANDGMAAIIADLTRERDEAREAHKQQERWTDAHMARVVKAESEVTRLTKALAAAEFTVNENALLTARVRELENAGCDMLGRARYAEARVEALETLLAASEVRAAQWQAAAESYRADATVAQDRLAALKAKVQRAVQRLTYDEELLAETRIERALEALRG